MAATTNSWSALTISFWAFCCSCRLRSSADILAATITGQGCIEIGSLALQLEPKMAAEGWCRRGWNTCD
eukprot:1275308-Lingulodinium_polyedra.AAC.1